MVAKVRLRGLNTVRSRGRWYVYRRATGECLLAGFEGTKDDLQKHMERAEFLEAYNKPRIDRSNREYPPESLGGLVHWWTTEAPEFAKLMPATKEDYIKAYKWLEAEFDVMLADIDQAGVYEVRDKCAAVKKARFADKMVSALSSMFGKAVKRGKMAYNPARGVEKISKPNPESNREWQPWEQSNVFEAAPPHILTPMMLARYVGYRGQTICRLTWRDYQKDPLTGRAFQTRSEKNGEPIWMPVVPTLLSYISEIEATSTFICTRKDGTPWKNEKQMQTSVSHFLKRQERAGRAKEGITLHGLRSTFAAGLRRGGADVGMVASALGDRSERMGAHYTRHVEREQKVIMALRSQL